ncbi:hypothetical protein, partial [Bacillus sp. S2-R3J1-FB-BA1]|uniref:hypothetical protein n=1 Tax=Bacillus sp. S2-R3J1-FB-BA1 TaxID=1973490 RepID=UPI001C54F75D
TRYEIQPESVAFEQSALEWVGVIVAAVGVKCWGGVLERRAAKDGRVRTVRRDLKAVKVPQDQQVLKVLLDLKGLKVFKDRRVLLALLVRKVLKGQRVLLALTVRQPRKDRGLLLGLAVAPVLRGRRLARAWSRAPAHRAPARDQTRPSRTRCRLRALTPSASD